MPVYVPKPVTSGVQRRRPAAKSCARTAAAQSRSHWRRGAMSSFTATLSEDRFGQKGRHDPVRRVDDLADLQIDRDRRHDVRLLAAEPALLYEVVDHVADRLLGGGEEVGTVRGGGVVRGAVGRAIERAARAQLRLGQPP